MNILEWSDERDKILPAYFAIVRDIGKVKAGRTGQEGNKKYQYANVNDFLDPVQEQCVANNCLLVQAVGGDGDAVILETTLVEVGSGQ